MVTGYSDLAPFPPAFSACANGGSSDCGIRIRRGILRALRRRSRTGITPVSPVDRCIIAQHGAKFNKNRLLKLWNCGKMIKTNIAAGLFGMGKSQRYQAAVDGLDSRFCHWHKLRRQRQPGVRSRNTKPAGAKRDSWGLSCGFSTALPQCLSVPKRGLFFMPKRRRTP